MSSCIEYTFFPVSNSTFTVHHRSNWFSLPGRCSYAITVMMSPSILSKSKWPWLNKNIAKYNGDPHDGLIKYFAIQTSIVFTLCVTSKHKEIDITRYHHHSCFWPSRSTIIISDHVHLDSEWREAWHQTSNPRTCWSKTRGKGHQHRSNLTSSNAHQATSMNYESRIKRLQIKK